IARSPSTPSSSAAHPSILPYLRLPRLPATCAVDPSSSLMSPCAPMDLSPLRVPPLLPRRSDPEAEQAAHVEARRHRSMNGLIRASLSNPYAVTVLALTMVVLGILAFVMIPIDILPVFKSPAVQVLTFYGGMPAEGIEKDITNRMERWVGQANGMQ